jgi:hypothetical protein
LLAARRPAKLVVQKCQRTKPVRTKPHN